MTRTTGGSACGGHFDEVEALAEGVLLRLGCGLDPDLRAVLVDEPDVGHPDRLVDANLGLRRPDFDSRASARSQMRVT